MPPKAIDNDTMSPAAKEALILRILELEDSAAAKKEGVLQAENKFKELLTTPNNLEKSKPAENGGEALKSYLAYLKTAPDRSNEFKKSIDRLRDFFKVVMEYITKDREQGAEGFIVTAGHVTK